MEKIDPRRFWTYSIVLLLALSTLPYINSLSGTPVWDDRVLINAEGCGISEGLWGAFTQPFLSDYFRPLTSLSFQIEYRIFGESPYFHHLTNLLLHLATVVFVVASGWRLFKDWTIALIAGALFGVQPYQASTVAWIGGRTDVLSTFFLTLFAYFFVSRFEYEKRAKWQIAAAVSLLFGMGSKEQTALVILCVPPAIALMSEPRQRSLKNLSLQSLPYLLSATAFALAWYASGVRIETVHSAPLSQRLDLAGRTFLHYAQTVFVPSPAMLNTFSLGNSRELGTWPVYVGGAIFLGLVVLLLRLFKTRNKLFVPLAIILVMIVPVSNLVTLPSFTVAPYRIGAAGPFIALCFAWALYQLTKRHWAFCAAATAALLTYHTYLTSWSSDQWRSERTLFANIV